MRLAEALVRIPQDRLFAIASEVDPGHGDRSAPFVASRVETVVKSPAHVERAIVRRRPPVLALLQHLLESGLSAPVEECSAKAMSVTDHLTERIASGDLLAREGCELYRRVLLEAWRSDLSIDPSEASLLGVLRRELGMSQVEHFLTAHHPDVRSYWDDGRPFITVKRALEDAGVLFEIDHTLVLPEDLVPSVRSAIGIPLDRSAALRLFASLTGEQIRAALQSAGLKSSGHKEEKVERLVEHYVSPKDVLDHAHIFDLRDLAESIGCRKSGVKEELIEQLIRHFAEGGDQMVDEPEPEPEVEPKQLSERAFSDLFGSLTGQELGAILWKLNDELAQSGSKSTRVDRLWESRFSETTLLSKLGGGDLAHILERIGLRQSGSKSDRIERLIANFLDSHREVRTADPIDAPGLETSTEIDRTADAD